MLQVELDWGTPGTSAQRRYTMQARAHTKKKHNQSQFLKRVYKPASRLKRTRLARFELNITNNGRRKPRFCHEIIPPLRLFCLKERNKERDAFHTEPGHTATQRDRCNSIAEQRVSYLDVSETLGKN